LEKDDGWDFFELCACRIISATRLDRESFDRFAFIFASNVPLTGYENLNSTIAWKLLGAEIVVIVFIGLAAGFFLSSRKS
jgi:hypothetical protein